MSRYWKYTAKVLVGLYLVLVHILAIGFIYVKYLEPVFFADEANIENVKVKTEPTVLPELTPYPSSSSSSNKSDSSIDEDTNQDTDQNTNQNTAQDITRDITPPPAENIKGKLMIPVIGVKSEQLQDTFKDSRSEGRVHNAIDIMAPLGTPVIATNDGEIAKFFDSDRGGITIYQYSPDKRYVYYYAHLQKRDDKIKEGDYIKQGTVIGYVGNTGNAGPDNYHLHFSISILEDPKKYYGGKDINPYPLLKDGIEASR